VIENEVDFSYDFHSEVTERQTEGRTERVSLVLSKWGNIEFTINAEEGETRNVCEEHFLSLLRQV